MSDGKGKGRAITVESGNTHNTTSGQLARGSDSLLGRVTSSAAGLVRNTITVPNSIELSSYGSTAISGSRKGGRASGSNSSAWAESSSATQPSALQNLQLQSQSSFRGGHTEEHVQRTEAEFSSFLGGIDTFKPSSEAGPEGALADVQETAESQGDFGSKAAARRDTYGISHYVSIQEQQVHDGGDVLAILTSRSHQDKPSDELLLVDEDIDWGLTEQQMLSLGPILNELFPPAPIHVSPAPDHPLNLVPRLASNEATPEIVSPIYSETAWRTWMNHWEGVLTRYTDEVWGELLPLVLKARQEVEAIQVNPQRVPSEQPGALRRLQLIRDHLRSQQ